MSTEVLFNRSRVGWIHWLVVVASHPGAEDISVERISSKYTTAAHNDEIPHYNDNHKVFLFKNFYIRILYKLNYNQQWKKCEKCPTNRNLYYGAWKGQINTCIYNPVNARKDLAGNL